MTGEQKLKELQERASRLVVDYVMPKNEEGSDEAVEKVLKRLEEGINGLVK